MWTQERLNAAARLYRLGVTPKAIAAEVDVPLSRLVWLIGYRKDLFAGRAAPRREPVMSAPVPRQQMRAIADARADIDADAVEPAGRRAAYEPGLADLMTERLFGPAPDGPCQLVHLTSRTCRWPVSGSGAATWYCAEAIAPGAGYCDCHRAQSSAVEVVE